MTTITTSAPREADAAEITATRDAYMTDLAKYLSTSSRDHGWGSTTIAQPSRKGAFFVCDLVDGNLRQRPDTTTSIRDLTDFAKVQAAYDATLQQIEQLKQSNDQHQYRIGVCPQFLARHYPAAFVPIVL